MLKKVYKKIKSKRGSATLLIINLVRVQSLLLQTENKGSRGESKGTVLECYVQLWPCFYYQRYHHQLKLNVVRQVMNSRTCEDAVMYPGWLLMLETIQLNLQ